MTEQLVEKTEIAIIRQNHPKHAPIMKFVTNHIFMPHIGQTYKDSTITYELIDMMMHDGLSETTLLDANSLLITDQKEESHLPYLGTYRTHPFSLPVSNTQGTPELTATITQDMARLLEMPRNNTIEIYKFFFELMRIHPFVDGNGRISRLAALCEMLRIRQIPFMFQTRYDLARFKLAYREWLLSGCAIEQEAMAMSILETSRKMTLRTLRTILES